MSHMHFSIRSGKRGAAADQIAYITRMGRHEQREDLVFVQHGNLPDWADSPNTFFNAADKGERKNGSIFRNIKLSLPNALTLDQDVELAIEIADALIGKKPYILAVHNCLSSIEGVRNPHVHLLYSDRADDGIDRSPALTFKRYNAKHPEKGGRKKDSGGKNALEMRDHLLAQRNKVAELTNRKLATHGHVERVDPRSLKDQGKRQKPERHLGQRRIREMSEREKEEYVEVRKERRQRDLC
ncbi:MAG: MobA/MobL family protein [Pseudoxanthomonas sp.]